jgi:purine-binding chemotaxis protein CheW
MHHLIAFTIDNQQFGLDLEHVEHIIWAVETTPLPNSPPFILGLINLQGLVLPVVDMRVIFNFQKRELAPEDRFIICQNSNKRLLLWVDQILSIQSYQIEELIPVQQVSCPIEFIDFVFKTQNELSLIVNLKELALFVQNFTEQLHGK